MKNYLFTALAAALMLNSCVSDEMIETASERTPITINAYTEGITRFIEANSATLQNGFTLFIKAGTDTLYQGPVTYNQQKFNLNKDVYWPLDETKDVTFAAISGSVEGTTVSIDGTTDILAAKITTKKTAGTTANLVFSHILSGAQFSLQAVNDKTEDILSASLTACTLTAKTNNKTYDYTTGTWGTAAPLATYSLIDDAVSVTTEAAPQGDELLLVPGTYTLSATYDVINAAGGTVDNFTRTAEIQVEAGSRYKYTIQLPVSPTEMTISVSGVSNWNPSGNATNVPVAD